MSQVAPVGAPQSARAFAVVGKLVASRPDELLVDCGEGPVPARHVARLSRGVLTAPGQVGREVLVVFDKGDAAGPIVLDFVTSTDGGSRQDEVPGLEARVDGERVVIQGRREILLRCGKAYILIRENGQVVIRGTDLLSRSTGVNKIKGGTVRIN